MCTQTQTFIHIQTNNHSPTLSDTWGYAIVRFISELLVFHCDDQSLKLG